MDKTEYLYQLEARKNSPAFSEFMDQYRRIKGCPVTATMQLIGGKWKPIILYMILHEVNRFGELQRIINGISKKILTEQLRQMEADSLIDRRQQDAKPLKVTYHLTPLGQTLLPVLDTVCNWGLDESHKLSKTAD